MAVTPSQTIHIVMKVWVHFGEVLGKSSTLPSHSCHALALSCSEHVQEWKVSGYFPSLVHRCHQSRIGGPGVQSENAFSVLLEQLGYALLFNHDELQSVNSLLKELVNGRTSATYRRSDSWNTRTEVIQPCCTLCSLFVCLYKKNPQISENRESALEKLMTEAVKALAFSLNATYW